MDMPVYRLIDLARLLFFRALLLEAERRRDVSPSTSAHDTLQTARTHRRRAARRGRGVRPTGTPLSARGFDSRQRAVDLRPMPDLCGQRARRGRLFAFDANGELIEAPTPGGDTPSSCGATRPSRRAADFSRGAVPCAERPMPSTAENVDASMRAVPFSERPVPSALLDSSFPERPVPSAAGDMPSAAWDVHAAVRDVLAPAEDVPSLERAARSSRRAVHSAKRSAPSLEEIVSSDLLDSPFSERAVQSLKRSVPSAKRSAPSLTEIVSSDLLDSPFSERAVRSAKRSVPSKTGTLHTRTADGVVAGEARYAALAKRSAQTADRLLRRVSRHRAKGR